MLMYDTMHHQTFHQMPELRFIISFFVFMENKNIKPDPPPPPPHTHTQINVHIQATSVTAAIIDYCRVKMMRSPKKVTFKVIPEFGIAHFFCAYLIKIIA